MKFEDLYYAELTTAVYAELLRIGEWFNRYLGHHPMLVGGWAVHTYNPAGLGSRDVDLIFQDRRSKDRAVNEYLRNNGYTRIKTTMFTEEYALLVRTARAEEHVYLDVATTKDRNLLRGTDIEIPWQLAFDHNRSTRIGKGEFYVPQREVLLVFKAKAALDRAKDAATAFDPFYLQQKVWKDYYDIASLAISGRVDPDLLGSLLDGCGFRDHFATSVGRLVEMDGIWDRHGIPRSDRSGRMAPLHEAISTRRRRTAREGSTRGRRRE